MNALFHRAKHWQLFSILYGGGILLELIFMFNMPRIFVRSVQMHQPPQLSGFFWFISLIVLFVSVIIYCWMWSVAIGLKSKLPRGVKLNHRLFKGFMWVAALYPVIHILVILLFFRGFENAVTAPNPVTLIKLIFGMMIGTVILLPIGLFAMFCSFYSFYFCAKTLKSIELGREAHLGEYIGYFFLFWFNFVGFWLIQPSVNTITSEGWVPPPTPPGYEPLLDPDPAFTPPSEREIVPRGELLKTKNHEAFEHDDDFEGLF